MRRCALLVAADQTAGAIGINIASGARGSNAKTLSFIARAAGAVIILNAGLTFCAQAVSGAGALKTGVASPVIATLFHTPARTFYTDPIFTAFAGQTINIRSAFGRAFNTFAVDALQAVVAFIVYQAFIAFLTLLSVEEIPKKQRQPDPENQNEEDK